MPCKHWQALHNLVGLQLLCDDDGPRRGQLVLAAGAVADSSDHKGLVGDKGQVRSSPGGWCRGRNRRAGKSPFPEPCMSQWYTIVGWSSLRGFTSKNGKVNVVSNLIKVYLVKSKRKLIGNQHFFKDGGNTVFIHYWSTADPTTVPLFGRIPLLKQWHCHPPHL